MTEKIISWVIIIVISRMIFDIFHVEFTIDDLYIMTFVWSIAALSNISITIKKEEEK